MIKIHTVLSNFNKHKIISLSILSVIFFLLAFTSKADVPSDSVESPSTDSDVEQLVKEVLLSAESSLKQVESNTAASLHDVEKALVGIRNIKQNLSADTHAELKSPLHVNESMEYWFIYPRVKQEILTNDEMFPTLNSKVESGILYQGMSDSKKIEKREIATAYFDYAFAYASLITAREALNAKNYREAVNSLKWVFEAVYINPDFYIAEFDASLKLDKLHNYNMHNPVLFSQVQ